MENGKWEMGNGKREDRPFDSGQMANIDGPVRLLLKFFERMLSIGWQGQSRGTKWGRGSCEAIKYATNCSEDNQAGQDTHCMQDIPNIGDINNQMAAAEMQR